VVNQQLNHWRYSGTRSEPDQIFKSETGIYFLEEPDPEANS
jgi:hypothetical protein